MQDLSIDFETRATCPLPDTGVYPYAAHPDTDLWCMAWGFVGEKADPRLWTPHAREHAFDCAIGLYGACDCRMLLNECPPAIVAHIRAGGKIRAWNAAFERIVWREIMVKRYGWPEVPLEQWVCSAAEAAAMALPRALGQAAEVLGVAQQKDTSGYNLMMRMTRPRQILDDGTLVWWDEEGTRLLAERERWRATRIERDLADVRAKFKALGDYCVQDVRTEQAIVGALRPLVPIEREIYLLDQRMNDRGITADVPLVLAAKDVALEGVLRANAALSVVTGGGVSKVTNAAGLRAWMREQGVLTASVDKATSAELLEGELPDAVRKALALRAEAGRSSIAKLDSILKVAGPDARLRGLLLYHAASTGRWGGRLVQPQNFMRGEVDDVESFMGAVLAGDYATLDLFAPPVVIVASMLRAMLTAAEGCDLIAGDFSAIEARVLNWLADEPETLENFRAYDRGDKSRDPYKRMAVAMGRAAAVAAVTKQDRQAGKAAELGCGFGMGWKKFITAAWDVYQVRVDETQSRTAVDRYRETHPNVKQFWTDANAACIAAVKRPGEAQVFGGLRNLKCAKLGSYLWIMLPSGRPLCFPAPKIVLAPTPWGEDSEAVEISGVNSFTKKWCRERLYGGIIVQNIVQAVARDLIAAAMLRLERRGYTPLLSVHDEAVCEIPKTFGHLTEFEQILAEAPAWATGCPIAAEAWRGQRYRK